MTSVEIRNNEDRARLEAVLEDGTVAGYADYRQRGATTYSFTHTEVADECEGMGIGGELVRGVMDFARDQGVKILPKCSFIRSYMRDHEETHDLLAKGARLDPDPEPAAS